MIGNNIEGGRINIDGPGPTSCLRAHVASYIPVRTAAPITGRILREAAFSSLASLSAAAGVYPPGVAHRRCHHDPDEFQGLDTTHKAFRLVVIVPRRPKGLCLK